MVSNFTAAVWVVVEGLPDDAKKLGLSEETIQTDVELKLRLAGMRVVTEQEGLKLTGGPHLYVNVNVVGLAARIDVELLQNASLERTGQWAAAVSTWDVGFLSSNPSGEYIRDRTKDLVDQFLNAWLSVNPKK